MPPSRTRLTSTETKHISLSQTVQTVLATRLKLLASYWEVKFRQGFATNLLLPHTPFIGSGGAFFFYFSNFKPIKRKKISLIGDIFIQHLLIQKLLLFFQLVLDLLLLHIGLIQLLLFCLLLLGL